MVEAAYVLPLMLGVILFIVEAVAYAMNSIAVNDVLTDVHSRITTEVSERSSAETAGEASALTLVSCLGSAGNGRVTLNSGTVITTITELADSYFEPRIALKDQVVTVTGPESVVGFDVYIVKYSALANPIVLPDFLSGILPVNVNTVISIKDSCTVSF